MTRWATSAACALRSATTPRRGCCKRWVGGLVVLLLRAASCAAQQAGLAPLSHRFADLLVLLPSQQVLMLDFQSGRSHGVCSAPT